MKKILFLSISVLIISNFIFSSTINFTSPSAGSEWCINDSCNKLLIRWNEIPKEHQIIKIRLFNSTRSTRIWGIIDNTENDGEFRWTINSTIAPGQYTVKVASLDNSVFAYSDVFTIKDCSGSTGVINAIGKIKMVPTIVKMTDLKVSIIFMPESPAINQNTDVRFKVENVGTYDSKPTNLKVFKGMINTDIWPIPALKPGRSYSLDKKLIPSNPGYIQWSADVDPSNLIGDIHRANNHASKRMIIRGPDLTIVSIHSTRYKERINQTCSMDVTVKNIGNADAGTFEIDCNWKPCPLIAEGRHYKIFNGVLKPGNSTTFHFTHKYACLGTKHVRLYVDKRNQIMEEKENNNTCGFTFYIKVNPPKYMVEKVVNCNN